MEETHEEMKVRDRLKLCMLRQNTLLSYVHLLSSCSLCMALSESFLVTLRSRGCNRGEIALANQTWHAEICSGKLVASFLVQTSCIAIPIALYRPHLGPRARNGEKMAEKRTLAPPRKRGKNGEAWGKQLSLTHFWADIPIFRPFFPIFPGGTKIHVSAIFSHFGPEARNGVCTGQSGSQILQKNNSERCCR